MKEKPDPPAAHFEVYIPFFTDYGFKATFCNEHDTLFLRRALQALLRLEIPIAEITFGKNTIDGFTLESRGGVYDLSCRDEQGNEYIVEMQLPFHRNFIQRLKFYALHKFDTLVRKGDATFEGISHIYCVAVLGFNLLQSKHFYNHSALRTESGERVDGQMDFVFVELEKFNKKPEDCTTDLDKLIFTMKEAHKVLENGQKPDFMEEDWLKSALEALDTRRLSPEDRADLTIAVVREMNQRYADTKRLEWAEEMGMERGMEKGMEKGIRQILLKTDWDDQRIAEMLEVPPELVRKVRSGINAGKNN